MSFLALNADVTDLRNSLHAYFGEGTLTDITVRLPARDQDEASFLRLVVWSYALLFEAGGVTIPYLLKLPDGNHRAHVNPSASRDLVRSLRTWTSHNLGLSDHDIGISREAMGWLRRICDTNSPGTCTEWKACFDGLCIEVNRMGITYLCTPARPLRLALITRFPRFG